MAKKDRDKQVWFIQKRANIHQMIALLHGIIERKYDGTTWNTQKQDNLNLELKKLGATRSGKKIAPQGMRTLVASVQYLGFVYLDTTTVPTTLRITKAGYEFYNTHKDELKPISQLTKELTINSSNHVLSQMNKLQITNPITLPHCENIYVFPFRVTLKMLLELVYLDKEEIAMYIFNTKTMSEIGFKIQEIKNFRSLLPIERERLVEKYKTTEIGNITLTQASSAGYFMQFCEGTGVIGRGNISTNRKGSIDSIAIKDGNKELVEEILDYFANVDAFDFKTDLKLWIDYFGYPERLKPPVVLTLNNVSGEEIYFEIIHKSEKMVDTGIFGNGDSYGIPIFEEENYTLRVFKVRDGLKLFEHDFIGKKGSPFEITLNSVNNQRSIISESPVLSLYDSFSVIAKEIIEHSNSKNFSEKMLQKLRLLKTRLGIDKTSDKSLRGAYYEQLFYDLLRDIKQKGIIDDAYWNGKIGKYDLPVQAPGGKTGTSDIIFVQNKIHYVLELTTIKGKASQFQAELSSVPDHIKLYNEKINNSAKVRGIFCAPDVHKRNHVAMKTILADQGIEFISITDKEIIRALNARSAKDLAENLEELFNTDRFSI